MHAIDIDPAMIETATENARRAGIQTIRFILRAVAEHGTRMESECADLVLLFILHFSDRRVMLAEASRILRPSGRVAIIHWRKDIATPRGPQIEDRPDQATILNSIGGLDLHFDGNSRILEPYH